MASRPRLFPLFAVATLTAATLFTGACGTDDNGPARSAKRPEAADEPASTGPVTCAEATITGAGSTFVQTLAQQWVKDYGAECAGATINYQGVGSGAGVQQFLSGTVDFAGSDAVLKPEEETGAGAVLHIPWAAGGIAVLYHLSGVDDLKLGPTTLAGIFAGTITTWDDAAIASENKGASLPAKPIQVVHRSDGSGTTKVFTSYLTAVAPSVWTAGADKDVPWPTGQGAKGSDGVSAAVQQADGAIGYAEYSFAEANGVTVASIGNEAGAYVKPTAKAVSAALREAEVPADLKIKVTYKPEDKAAYPISTTTWAIVHTDTSDPAKAKLLKGFLLYAVGKGQAAATGLFYAPLPQEIAVRAQAAVYQLKG
ncbi:MAG TPA: phosphate ABC transporter substrate-binding protein PstS [Acidimicrobiales bacterium]|nr:phosphate ABC transporter substrate-binding protein PstS [Acidimicrobiales bacterium]